MIGDRGVRQECRTYKIPLHCRCDILVALFFIVAFLLLLRFLPIPPLLDPTPGSRPVFSRTGELLNFDLASDEKYRMFLPLEQISPSVVDATLLYEDRYFRYHPGVNPWSIIRGAAASIRNTSRPVGGSTITMQLVRLRMGLQTKSAWGKLKQIFWALAFEARFSKREILEAYFNAAPYGANIEGAGAASLIYYRKAAKDLTPEEAMSLAVLPQSPSLRWREKGKAGFERARNFLSKQWEGGTRAPRDFLSTAADVPRKAPHAAQRLRIASAAPELRTTLDGPLQEEAEGVLREWLTRFAEYGVVNGAIVVAELPSMAVRAYVGSAGYLDERISGYVNGLAAKRSPGSLLKPFIYSLAIDQGRLLPESMLSDVPLRLSSYQPENFERNFLGPISATDALVRSRNIPALEVFRDLEEESLYRFLAAAGVSDLRKPEYYGIGLVLGGLGTSPEEIAALYGVLGNYGTAAPLRFFENPEAEKSAKPVRLFSPEAAFITREMLSKNPSPIHSRLRLPWKTGTSYGSRDAWAAGLTGPYVVVVWLGNFDGKSNPNIVGRDFAGPVFFSLAERLMKYQHPLPPQPKEKLNVKHVEVCALTGAVPGEYCPHRKESWFIPGVSPIARCSVHRRLLVNPQTGLRSCPWKTEGEWKVYEIWDSGLLTLFTKAGMQRNIPPPYEPECRLASFPDRTLRITSPEQYVQYVLEPHRPLNIEFAASVPGDARVVSWFVGDRLVGQVTPTQTFLWTARPGVHDVRAVDDLGRAGSVEIRVQTGL